MPPASIRILYLIDEMIALTAGGTERQILQMAEMMRQSGNHVELCVLRGTEWLHGGVVSVPVHFAGFHGLSRPSGWLALLQLVRWMRSQRFDILQTFFVESNLLGPGLGRLAGVPVTLGSRRNLNYWMDSKAAVLQNISNFFATRLVANSEVVKQCVRTSERTDIAKIDVIYNAIDLSQYQPDRLAREQIRKELGVAPDEILIGNVSSLRPIKGIEIFVEAAGFLSQRYLHARFVLVGDGPLRASTEQAVDKAGLSQAFIFAGAQVDVPRFLQAFDVAVLSSDSEGFSNSILEYMAMGLPVVSTDVGGNAEALAGTGRLVPVRDSAALAGAISEFIEHPRLAQECGSAARQRVHAFGLAVTQQRLNDYYMNLLNAK